MTQLSSNVSNEKITIAVLGGTGAEGSGLALRWARAGHRVILGSRSPDRAVARVAELNAALGREAIEWASNREAAIAADTVVLTVPYTAQTATVEEVRDCLDGKILIDATVPLMPPKVNRVQLPAAGSAVAAIQDLLGDGVRVVSAFQNVSAHHLKDLEHELDCDVLVCGNDVEARTRVIGLIKDLGLRGIHAGPICNSAAAEALTSILISINMAYKIPGAGLRITGLPE
ncbi:NADPH-dependent F420 reductase [Paraburkholderia antibiotica]|uniref:NADPH-dependent F420 reductase n=1 Tax=Paraburkholderia antibiotica TaxID=2728839 RepID=A0A7X9X7G3_9BURK|nr:NADPH-dependent F420 reductase [Paraburkholderia antibiotica]NML32881.1 NADPH-dependent F420 reductase [Paraburkholderia antibiotica]